ncbi:MAG: hypothetical protein ABSH52_16300 [Terriglobia bacterium]
MAQRDIPSGPDVLYFAAYRQGEPITQWPLKKTLHQIPELKGLKPVADQRQLSQILDRISGNLQEFVENLVSTTSLETIEETAKGGKPRKAQRVEKFRYLMLARPQANTSALTEYRTDLQGREIPSGKFATNFMKTAGFAAIPLLFGPLQQPWSDFRHLGEQMVDGRSTQVVAFAEHVWPVAVTGRWVDGGASIPLLLQGVAWIRSGDYQILQMRTDLLAPVPPLMRLTMHVRYANTQFEGGPVVFWLPQEVQVTAYLGRSVYTNRHTYSDYRLFRVESVIKP